MAPTLSLRMMLHLFLIRPLVSIFFGVNAVGGESLSRFHQFIIISNHNSHLDTCLLFQILPPERIAKTRIVAAADYFAKKPRLCRLVTLLFNPIWVDRRKQSCSAIAEIIDHLRNKGSLIMFPEGTRSNDGEFKPLKLGFCALARRSKSSLKRFHRSPP